MASKIRNRTAAIMLVLALAAMPVSAAAQELVPGGKAIGIRMTTQGVVVAGVSEVESGGVKKSPAAEAGIAPGDVIVRLGPAQINSAADFIAAVAKLDGTPVAVQVTRQGKTKQFTVTPAKDADGKLRHASSRTVSRRGLIVACFTACAMVFGGGGSPSPMAEIIVQSGFVAAVLGWVWWAQRAGQTPQAVGYSAVQQK